MILIERKATYFNPRKVGVPHFDGILRDLDHAQNEENITYEIEWMKPMEYVERCAKGMRQSVSRLLKDRTNQYSEKYANMMRNGTKFDMLYLEYDSDGFRGQEGLHRAVAAMSIDPDKKVPVMVVEPWLSEDEFTKLVRARFGVTW